MGTAYDELLAAINGGDAAEAERLIETGLNLNSPCDEGATPQF